MTSRYVRKSAAVRVEQWQTVADDRRVLRTSPENLSQKQREYLNVITARDAAQAEAYRLMETLRYFHRQAVHRG